MLAQSAPRVVVVGGGFGGLETAFNLRLRLGKRVDLTVISDRDQFLFRPNTIYIPFGADPARFQIALRPALERRGIRFVPGRAEAILPAAKRVSTAAGEIEYDYLVVATGAAMHPQELPGLAEHANTLWSPAEMLALRESLARAVAGGGPGVRRVLFLVPVNNKCSGPLYELVFMLDTWLRRRHVRDKLALTYATFEGGFVQAFGPRLDPMIADEFRKRDIAGFKQRRARAVEPGEVRFEDGSVLPYDVLVTFPPYVASTRFPSLPADERGFLRTAGDARQVDGHPDIYAVGDAGDFPIKQAFLAMLQADAAAEHIGQRVQGQPATARFDPVAMCVMEQLDKALFTRVPLGLTGDPQRPVAVRADRTDLYQVGAGRVWRVGKKAIGTVLPARFRAGRPFHAGAPWEVMDAGLKVMSSLFATAGSGETPSPGR